MADGIWSWPTYWLQCLWYSCLHYAVTRLRRAVRIHQQAFYVFIYLFLKLKWDGLFSTLETVEILIPYHHLKLDFTFINNKKNLVCKNLFFLGHWGSRITLALFFSDFLYPLQPFPVQRQGRGNRGVQGSLCLCLKDGSSPLEPLFQNIMWGFFPNRSFPQGQIPHILNAIRLKIWDLFSLFLLISNWVRWNIQ